MAVFLDAYGIGVAFAPDGVVGAVAARQDVPADAVRVLAARGRQPQRDRVAGGHLDELARRAAWTRANAHLVEP